MPPQPFASLQMPCGLATLLRSKRMVAGMSVSRNRLNGTGVRISEATAGDFFALLKPRVMALAVFTAFVGLMVAPGAMNPVIALIAMRPLRLERERPARSTCGTMRISTR